MSIRRWVVVVAAVVFMAGPVFAEEAAEAPQAMGPTPEHRELAMWIGSWTGTGDMKAGDFGPGGTMNWTEECSWFAGSEFHVVCKSEGESSMGPMVGLGIIGYNPARKVYTHYGVDSSGWSGYAEGSRTESGWAFQSTETMGGKTFQSRFTMDMKSPTEMSFSWEISEDGETWTVMMDGVSKKN